MDQNDTPQPPKGTTTGWSKAAQRRRARRYGANRPTSQTPTTSPGYIVLDDTEDGGGQAQIWDRS